MNNPSVSVEPTPAQKRSLHPILMMLAILVFAMALTYLLGAGQFKRNGHLVAYFGERDRRFWEGD